MYMTFPRITKHYLATQLIAPLTVMVVTMLLTCTPLVGADSVVAKESGEVRRSAMTKSPSGAILRSLVFPGWGQLYTESYLKAGAFGVAAVSVGGIIVWNQGKYSDAAGRYDALSGSDPLKEKTFKEKEFYRDQRDVAGLWLLGVYALAAVDAYVGAHLFDFDVSDKGVSWLALPSGGALSSTVVAVSVHF